MYEQSQFIPQGLNNIKQQARNLINNPYLPIINTRQQIMEEEKYKHLQKSLNYINNRAQRSLKFISQNNNFPMYDPGIFHLANQFPQNMLNFRPIRYFFQRPVYVDSSQPEVRQIIAERNTDRFVSETIDKAKKAYAIPLKYEDLIKNGEVLNQALAKVIDPKEVQEQLQKIENQKQNLFNKKEKEVNLGKQRTLKRRVGTKERIKKLSKTMKMYCFFKIYIKFSLSLKYIKKNEDNIMKNAKASLHEITSFIVSIIKIHLEDYFSVNLRKKIELTKQNSSIIEMVYTNPSLINRTQENVEYIPKTEKKSNPFFKNTKKEKELKIVKDDQIQEETKGISEEKVENSIFILKTTIHNIMNALSSNINKGEDIPVKVKKAFKAFIAEGALLPKSFLTSFEFNRLEWSLRIKLIRMKSEKKAMLISTIMLYRVLVMNVLMNIFEYFPQFKKINDKNVKNVDKNIDYNFKLIGYILSKIFKESTPRPKIFREHFKDKHLFNYYVLDSKLNESKGDLFELEKLLPICPEGDEFLVNNYKWVTLYKLSASSLCTNIVEYIN